MEHKTGRRDWVLTYVPVFLWIGVVLFLGSGSGSAAETSRIIGPLIAFLFPDADPSFAYTVHAVIRKSAHVTEYGILAALASRGILKSSFPKLTRIWPIPVLLLVAAIASLDEFNQSFNPQRTSSPWDVALDVSGGLLAVSLIWIYRRRQKHRRERVGF